MGSCDVDVARLGVNSGFVNDLPRVFLVSGTLDIEKFLGQGRQQLAVDSTKAAIGQHGDDIAGAGLLFDRCDD